MTDQKGRLRFVFINGGPASGKDTQAGLLAKKLPDSVVISPGEILRDLATNHSKSEYKTFFDINTANLKVKMAQGRNVDGRTLTRGMVNLVNHEIEEGKRSFVFAGYPREERSYWGISMYLRDLLNEGRFETVEDRYVYLYATDGELWKRYDKRVEDAVKRGEELRHDDLHGEFDDRISSFKENALPLMQDMRMDGKLIVIDAMGNRDETQLRIVRALGLHKKSSIEGSAHNPQMRK